MTDIFDPDYKSDLTEDEHNRLALMCGHAVAPPLSHAARAVWEAAMNTPEDMPYEHDLAAALRAAADQAEDVCPAQPYTEWGEGWLNGVQDVAAGLRRIADELKSQ